MRVRVEYSREDGHNPKAIELSSSGDIRELTYEAMDEVLKAEISQAEVRGITWLLNSLYLSRDHFAILFDQRSLCPVCLPDFHYELYGSLITNIAL
jgi:hypothetical protein